MDRMRPAFVTVAALAVGAIVAACSPVSPTTARDQTVAPRRGPPPSPRSSFDPTATTAAVRVVASGLASPTDVTNAGDGSGRLFVAEQAGRIRIVKDGALLDRPFLDITGRIASGGERGLLGLAFHPDYPTDPRFFVDYTDRDGNTVVSPFRVSATDPRRRRPGQRDRPAPHRPAVREPQRRCRRVRAGRHALHRDGRRRVRRRSAGQRPAPRHASWPRSCASTWTSRRAPRALRGAARQPVRGSRRRQAGDLADRPAQPVADALRSRHRRSLDRRRRAGRVGGDRRGAHGRPASTTGGTRWKASTASSRRRAATRPA